MSTQPHLQVCNTAGSKSGMFSLFPLFPKEIRILIWQHLMRRRRLIRLQLSPRARTHADGEPDLGARIGPATPTSDGRHYDVVAEGCQLLSKLLRVNSEARQEAQAFYRVHVPCTFRWKGVLSEPGFLLLNPELDVLHLHSGQGRDNFADFVCDLSALDPRGIGLRNLAFGSNDVLSLLRTDLTESDASARAVFLDTLSQLQEVFHVGEGAAGRIYFGRRTGMIAIRRVEFHRGCPIMAKTPTFDLLPRDPRPIEKDLRQVFIGTGDPRRYVFLWRKLLQGWGIHPPPSIEYRFLVFNTKSYGEIDITDRESAEEWLRLENECWIEGQRTNGVTAPVESAEDLEGAVRPAVGFWLFPIESLGPLPGDEEDYDRRSRYWKSQMMPDMAEYWPQLGLANSIKSVSKQMAQDLMSFYTGNQPGQIPGLLPNPYYWWEGGALMGALVDYWYYTGDTTYNDITQQGLLHQVGPYNDYMPPNQTLTEGNDDQGFWGMAVMSAAEYKFQNPPAGQPQWLALAQAVFNTQAARWDTEHCNGGLRWQIFQWNNGYDYKNSISQACFFNLAARLALYTGNSTYADWAVTSWDWMRSVKLIDENYRIRDGVSIKDNCATLTPYEFSYNVGAFLVGAAAMVEYTNNTKQSSDVDMWHDRVDGLLNNTELIFFYGNDTADKVMIEIACEPVNLCDVDQMSFKAYLSRWMAATTKWAPWTFDRIKTLLQNSATAAADQCTGGSNGRMCGLKWANNSGQWDGTIGVGQQMAAMEVVLANMIQQAQAPVTDGTGGTSVGNPSAGGSDEGRYDPVTWRHGSISNGDRAGAIICTVFVLGSFLAALVFMIADETRPAAANWDDFRTSMSVLPRGSRRPTMDEKGKGVGSDRSSSTGTDEKIPAACGNFDRPPPPTRQPDGRRKRLERPAVKFSPASDTTLTTPSRAKRHSTRTLDPRPSILKKKPRPLSV
ncbi:Uu.00g111040.m01.CDS01 [Anthostomella pinea]|uniref:mannan endo-1,6-alpha-mannosidase n=1 Tax=Anthostomella pinea TaxID=933095 RepID=A0AAI8VFI5_9PEZI|nr:Uu.00g111040.m01.CDS01 [Anthostomella pinea]